MNFFKIFVFDIWEKSRSFESLHAYLKTLRWAPPPALIGSKGDSSIYIQVWLKSYKILERFSRFYFTNIIMSYNVFRCHLITWKMKMTSKNKVKMKRSLKWIKPKNENNLKNRDNIKNYETYNRGEGFQFIARKRRQERLKV